ncbi:MAG: MFS transporter [Gammaproteobacteria bacterium]|nr:MFS transporter [Gammaproteobacteria bacterium]
MPYWRLSGFYLFYFAALGAFLPYWGLYLHSLSFSPLEIGELMATIGFTKVIAPNVWGYLADHTGKRMTVVRVGCACAVLAFTGVFFAHGYWWLLLVMMVYGFFWNAALPQFEATTLTHLGDATHRYSSIRLWGSIGFIASVAALGPVLQIYGESVLPIIVIVLISAIFIASLWVKENTAVPVHVAHEPLRSLLQRREVLALLVICFLMQASHGPYYIFYTLYLEAHSYSRTSIGQLWAFGVIAEVVLFLVMHRLIGRFDLRSLLLFSAALTTARWVIIGVYVDNLTIVIFAQTLHAASFAIYHAVAIELIHRYFTGKHQGKGQALYSSVSFGLGGAIGSLYAGYVWDGLGGAATFAGAGVFSLLAFGIAWRFVPRNR